MEQRKCETGVKGCAVLKLWHSKRKLQRKLKFHVAVTVPSSGC